MKVFNESGHGYWLDGFGCLRAEGENRPSRPGHIVVGCDLCNGQMTGEEVCYSVGGPRNGFYETECSRTLDINCGNPGCNQGGMVVLHKAQMGDNQPAICFQQNQREEVRDMGEKAGTLTAESGMHNTNYICYAIDHVVTTGGNCTAQGPCWYENICPTEKAGGVHAVCYAVYDARGNGEGGMAPTITGDHNGRITDYTSVVVMALGGTDAKASVTDGTVAPCVLARAGTGGCNEPIILMENDNGMEMRRERSITPDVNAFDNEHA